MKIEWASHFHPDGRRRTPPPSTMHGWLAKMRGTLIGDEELRSKGMREMKNAKYERQRQAAKKKHHTSSTGRSIFSFLGFGKSVQAKHIHHHQSMKPRETAKLTRPNPQGGKPVRSSPRPSGTTHRTSHRSHRHGHPEQTYPGHGQRRSSRR